MAWGTLNGKAEVKDSIKAVVWLLRTGTGFDPSPEHHGRSGSSDVGGFAPIAIPPT
ncbi:MAG: hypothetical protein ACO34J_14200 [Prochlorothrix sp.]